MEYKIEIPAKVEYMRVKHIPFLLELQKYEKTEPTIGAITRMVSMFVEIPLVKLKRFPQNQIREVFNAIVKAFGTYKQSPIPMTLTYPNEEGDEVEFEFIKDFTKLPVDWFIDFDKVESLDDNPIEMMGFSYVEKGMEYGQADKHENVINPRSVRNKIFAEHLPLNVYMDVQAFFLSNWNILQQLSTEAKSLIQDS